MGNEHDHAKIVAAREKVRKDSLSIDYCGNAHVLNAAGTPMMRPLPFNSLAMDTLLPGEFSTSSTSGIASPTLTKAREDAWKGRRATALEPAKSVRRAANMVCLRATTRISTGCSGRRRQLV